MSNIFTQYVTNISDKKILDASSWFNNKVNNLDEQRDLANNSKQVNTSQLIKENNINAVSNVKTGHLYLFRYNPKFRQKLPYYDVFPVIFIVEKVPNGFLGLNMHYLPFEFRARLMDALYEYVTGEDTNQKIRVTYKILKSTSKLKYFKPCFKHYLNNHIMSRFLHVHPQEWDTAVFLPLQKFIKATTQQVHRDSIKLIRKPTLPRLKNK